MAARLQSSTEFLAILAAVAAFSVVVVAVYAHFGSDQKALYGGIAMLSGNHIGHGAINSTAPQDPEMYVTAPNTTQVNASTGIYLIVSGSGDISVEASATGYGGISVYPGYENATISGFGILEFTSIAGSPGEKTVSISARAASGAAVTTKNVSVQLLAVNGQGPLNQAPQNTSFTGTITERGQEKINYQVSKPSQIHNVTYWSHCTYIGFFGGVQPEPAQCGSNTWGFDTGDSSCNVFAYDGDNRYYCFALQNDNANSSSVGQQSGYLYNMTLDISNASLSLQASLTNNATTSMLSSGNGGDYGYAEVTSVYGPDVYPVPYLSYAVLGRPGGMLPVNISIYSSYSSLYSQVTQLLNVYNSAGGADLGYLEGLVSELNTGASRLTGSQQANNSACSLTNQKYPAYYSCNTHDLSYNILVHLNGSQYSNANKTFYIGSSVVKVVG